MSRVLVTGGAGFVGAHVVQSLLDAGLEPVVFDVQVPHADVEYVAGDVRDEGAVGRALRGVDRVCHQAAMVGLGVDLGDLPAYVSHNDLGTATLLRALARHPPERIVLASSMVVYGEGRYRCPAHGILSAPPRAAER